MSQIDAADARVFQPHVARNKEPIGKVLAELLPDGAAVLEVGSGTGEHASYFASRFKERGITWQPTEYNADRLECIDAFRAHANCDNLQKARALDVTQEDWGTWDSGSGSPAGFDVIYAANVIHIAPWAVAVGLVRGAARLLPEHGWLITYGPYRVAGEHTAPSNAAFDERLRSEDPAWGIRDVEALELIAQGNGLSLSRRIAMPANNFVLVFSRKR